MSLAEFLGRPNGDIKSLGDGQYLICPKEKDGYYLQSCKLVIWTPSEDIELEIPFDKHYTDAQVQHLQNFFFVHMLPRLADDFADKKIHLCPTYLQMFNA
ncbi:hypothetical protein R3I93_016902 [Phoxinus phoxinus]|uniref:Uncharacterized protein n=1 Tax=Phoxinus phoxinus TaxID=58324 RepID=A0AAN9GXM2_9TELE